MQERSFEGDQLVPRMHRCTYRAAVAFEIDNGIIVEKETLELQSQFILSKGRTSRGFQGSLPGEGHPSLSLRLKDIRYWVPPYELWSSPSEIYSKISHTRLKHLDLVTTYRPMSEKRHVSPLIPVSIAF